MKLYCVVDRKAKSIVSVFSSVSNEAAERSFLMLLTGERNIFTDFPEDFDLYPVAELSVKGQVLNVSMHDYENLRNHGFEYGSFVVSDSIKCGADYDKRYLAMLHADRFPVLDNAVERDLVDNENKEN